MSRVPLIVWFLIPTVLLLGAGIWFFSKSTPEVNDEGKPEAVSQTVEGTVDYEIVGADHIAEGTNGSGYNSNPPSSGPHWANPAPAGFYDTSQPDERFIHNLEHGHVWIAYKPDIPEEVKGKLKEIIEKEGWKVTASPRESNDTNIALVAWGRVLKMQEPDYGKIEEFIKTYRNRGPEDTPQ